MRGITFATLMVAIEISSASWGKPDETPKRDKDILGWASFTFLFAAVICAIMGV